MQLLAYLVRKREDQGFAEIMESCFIMEIWSSVYLALVDIERFLTQHQHICNQR